MNRARRWGGRALAGLAALLVVLSILPLWETDRWWVRQWDYPRLQVAGLLVLLAPLVWWLRPLSGRRLWLLLGAMLAALAWQVSHFLAYLPLYPKEIASTQRCAPSRTVRMLNINVLQTNDRYGELLALVAREDADVVLLLETDAAWARAVAPLAKRYPYRLVQPLPSTYGMMLFSRLPMTGEVRHMLQPAVPSMAVRLRLDDGQRIDLYALHPEPPWPGDDSGERDAELVAVGREARRNGQAAIVMGDLNDVAWSRTSRLFKRVAGMQDPRVGRGFYPTFNARYPLLRWPLDHLFVSPHFEMMAIDRLGDIGSDHFPIGFTVCLTDRAGSRQVDRRAGGKAEAEANEEVREGVGEAREEDGGR